ncbi:MAG TPA: phosphogluconate dehydrogenase (NADP(+)-dependent, decarboxylating) [Rikenellaceae bacterium]|nr:phosphogluconate dehydrogenase (NADP(+)-dependent, decarboxylating) [Rikenellaceae bacterium]
MEKSDIGLIGLAVMGENLVLNMESKGFNVSVFNRTKQVTDKFLSGRALGKNIRGYATIAEMVNSLACPRKVMLMVKAGAAVDIIIEELIPLLEKGDIIIDGGNSHFADTNRRLKYVESKGLLFVGTGVSGGEEGALKGPSIMPGGSFEAWQHIRPLFTKIAAKSEDGSPCCEWIGGGGSGHFVKMVHNGIEYGDMQLISEAYSVMKNMVNLSNNEIGNIFNEWNQGKLQSYLIEITSHIMLHKEKDGNYLIDKILDAAGQKGTGKWSVNSAMDLGIPLNLIATAVFERSLSARKELREEASKVYHRIANTFATPGIIEIHDSLYASKLTSYAQGFEMMQKASVEYAWDLNFASIARIWRNGCIIRSGFLNRISDAYEKNPQLEALLLSDYFVNEINAALPNWKSLISKAVLAGISLPAFSSAINYFYSFTTANSPASIIQAQRDYFGAHTFERTDMPRGEFFHENWTGEGGETSSGTYNI